MKYLLLTALFGFLTTGQLGINTSKSSLKITGTSSLHDWEMTVNEYNATGVITASTVENLKMTVTSKSMKSGKSIMDDKAYDAVNAKKYPTIQFEAKSLKLSGGKLMGKGELTIAGVSNELALNAEIVSNTSTEMRLKGEIPLKLADYDIEPPTAMFGTLKTGDEIAIVFDMVINK